MVHGVRTSYSARRNTVYIYMHALRTTSACAVAETVNNIVHACSGTARILIYVNEGSIAKFLRSTEVLCAQFLDNWGQIHIFT